MPISLVRMMAGYASKENGVWPPGLSPTSQTSTPTLLWEHLLGLARCTLMRWANGGSSHDEAYGPAAGLGGMVTGDIHTRSMTEGCH